VLVDIVKMVLQEMVVAEEELEVLENTKVLQIAIVLHLKMVILVEQRLQLQPKHIQ
jgi:hypothetical protein